MEEQHKYSFKKFNTLSAQSITSQFQRLQQEFYGSTKYENQLCDCQGGDHAMNRYNNILPCKLIFNTDKNNMVKHKAHNYFNASEIKLLYGERVIATQAPVKPFDHFWKVVLEQNVGLLVMLCALEDPKRGKQADKYWPDEGTLKQGTVEVTLKSTKTIQDKFIKRQFIVKDGTTQKIVTQLHWFGWKDFGVPTNQSINIVEQLVSGIHEHFAKKDNIVLHCSAGVGRTGTLIAIIDGIGLIERGDKEISIHDIVANIRRQRFGSVQTKEQYEFIYKFLRRYLTTKNLV